MKQNLSLVDTKKSLTFEDAVEVLKKAPPIKFDASVDVQLKLNANPTASDQVIRGTRSKKINFSF